MEEPHGAGRRVYEALDDGPVVLEVVPDDEAPRRAREQPRARRDLVVAVRREPRRAPPAGLAEEVVADGHEDGVDVREEHVAEPAVVPLGADLRVDGVDHDERRAAPADGLDDGQGPQQLRGDPAPRRRQPEPHGAALVLGVGVDGDHAVEADLADEGRRLAHAGAHDDAGLVQHDVRIARGQERLGVARGCGGCGSHAARTMMPCNLNIKPQQSTLRMQKHT